MAVSVYAFGTGGKRANTFKDIYFSIEDVDGVGVLYTKTGETLGEGYALHKQDVFVRKSFDGRALQVSDSGKFLSNAYFRFFNGRPYIEGCTYLVITQESKKSALLSYDNSKWRDFLVKIRKVADQLHDGGIKSAEFLNVQQAREYADRFFALNFRDAHF